MNLHRRLEAWRLRAVLAVKAGDANAVTVAALACLMCMAAMEGKYQGEAAQTTPIPGEEHRH